MNTVTTAQLEQLLIDNGSEIALINVVPEEFHESMHIPGSVNICVYEVVFADKIAAAYPNRDQRIIVYGRNQEFSAAERAAGILEEDGYTRVSVYPDGIEGWREAGKEVSGTHADVPESIPDGRYELDLAESYLQWEGSNIANRHYGTIGLTAGWVQFESNRIIAGSLILDMTDIRSEDLAGTASHDVLIHHLQSADFFLTEKYPEAVLEIAEASRIPGAVSSEPNYEATGNLTLRGVTNPVGWHMTVGLAGECPVAQGHLPLDRTRWQSTYGSGKHFEWLGKHLVHDFVHLRFKLVMCPI